jgi:pimeloyl-ACP methyl ester carboxylesterase
LTPRALIAFVGASASARPNEETSEGSRHRHKGGQQHLRQELSAIVSEFHPVGFRLMSLSSAEVDTRGLLPSLDVATMVLWGDDDRRSPLHVAEQFHAAIPGAELAIIPNAGHLSNMEQPDAFNGHVRRFCLSA